MRNGFLYVILGAVLLVFLFTTLRQSRETVDVISISQVAADVQAGKIKQISEKNGEIDVTYNDESTPAVKSRIEQDNFDLVKTLHSLGVTDEQLSGVEVEFIPTSRWENLAPVLFAFLPIVLIALFFFFILRQAQGAGNQAFSFGKSKYTLSLLAALAALGYWWRGAASRRRASDVHHPFYKCLREAWVVHENIRQYD